MVQEQDDAESESLNLEQSVRAAKFNKEEDYTDKPEKIWEDLKELKKFENNIFFKSITGKTKELFK